jgi:DNA repair exonuclease SbcCD nuclease subunit
MTLAHLSDTHLGFHSFAATADGFNQREIDVMKTFESVLTAIGERDPDLIVHSGDVFHMVRPSNLTIVRAFRLIRDLQVKRKGKPFLIIGGNHDTPKMAGSGSILRLFEAIPGVMVDAKDLRPREIPELDCEILSVPNESLRAAQNFEYVPITGRGVRILVLHGMAYQIVPQAADFDIGEMRQDRWTYVALGDYHCFKPYGENICYAGSTDYTSTNIWEETAVPKGWVWFDTASCQMQHVPIQTRTVLDLPRIDASHLDIPQIEKKMLENAQAIDSCEKPIVRQRVVNVLPGVRAQISQRVLRSLQEKCLDYRLEPLPPMIGAPDSAPERPRGKTLEMSWEEHIGRASLPAGVSRAELIATGKDLLEEVREHEAAPLEA